MQYKFIISLTALNLLKTVIAATSLFEPTTGIYFGAWVDSSNNTASPPVPNDTPTAFNARVGQSAAFFQLSENFPLDFNNPPPVQLIVDTQTNAFIYLTVYAQPIGLIGITATQVDDLVKQIAGYTAAGRRVFLRLCPEMNGSWFVYAQQPTAFLAFWKQVYTAINANVLSQGKVAMIWAPSYALGYPFAGGAYSIASTTSADFKLLDTNHDGVLNGLDDPYSPYYPGDSFVDWVGLSTYYFGLTFPWINNQLPPAGQFSNILSGENGFGGSNFYATYCATGGQKPFFVTEGAASFHTAFLSNSSAVLAPGPGALAIKQAFWQEWVTNATLQIAYPKLKAVCLFEYLKAEETTMRDFRVTFDTIGAFKTDMTANLKNYIFAGASGSSAGANPGPKSGVQIVTPFSISALVFGVALLFYLP